MTEARIYEESDADEIRNRRYQRYYRFGRFWYSPLSSYNVKAINNTPERVEREVRKHARRMRPHCPAYKLVRCGDWIHYCPRAAWCILPGDDVRRYCSDCPETCYRDRIEGRKVDA